MLRDIIASHTIATIHPNPSFLSALDNPNLVFFETFTACCLVICGKVVPLQPCFARDTQKVGSTLPITTSEKRSHSVTRASAHSAQAFQRLLRLVVSRECVGMTCASILLRTNIIRIMKATTFIGQVVISAFTCAVIMHFAIPYYVRDVVNEMDCEKEDRRIIQSLDPSAVYPITHQELHKKREEVLNNYYKQIEDKKEKERQGNILKDVLGEVQIMSEEEIAKEAERIRQQEDNK